MPKSPKTKAEGAKPKRKPRKIIAQTKPQPEQPDDPRDMLESVLSTTRLDWPFVGDDIKEVASKLLDAIECLMHKAIDPQADRDRTDAIERLKKIEPTRLEEGNPIQQAGDQIRRYYASMEGLSNRELTSRLLADLMFKFVRVWPGDKFVAPALRSLYRDKNSGFAKRWDNELVANSKRGRKPNINAEKVVLRVYKESELAKNSVLLGGDSWTERAIDVDIRTRTDQFVNRYAPSAACSDINERGNMIRLVHCAKTDHFNHYFANVIEPFARRRFEASGEKYTKRVKDSMIRCLKNELRKEDV